MILHMESLTNALFGLFLTIFVCSIVCFFGSSCSYFFYDYICLVDMLFDILNPYPFDKLSMDYIRK